MYCESCGSFINDGEAFCSNCGSPAPRDSAPAAPSPAPAPQATVQPIAQPVQTAYQPYQQPQYQQPAYQQPVQMAQPIYQPVYQQPVIITPINNTRTRVNVAATVGLVLGIITLCAAWIPVVNILPAIPGLIFSIVGVAKKDAGGKGRAITGLIMSSIGLFISILFIIEMIAGELNY
ncbi:MAG: hypothetical protein E7383_02290 [Ruminococcaceae bacterium]|nr:hypothetical protein [Oscillospiraceae bacterium]